MMIMEMFQQEVIDMEELIKMNIYTGDHEKLKNKDCEDKEDLSESDKTFRCVDRACELAKTRLENKLIPACSSCGVNSVTVVPGILEHGFHPLNKEGEKPGKASCVPSFLVVCNNCGLITSYSLGIIVPEYTHNKR